MEERKKRIGLTWAVIILSLLVVGAAVAFGIIFGLNKGGDPVASANMLEASYSRAYYSLTDELNDMSVNLKKVDAINSSKTQQDMLYEVWASAVKASDNLSSLSVEGEGSIKLKRFVNQLGDYSKYLAKKGESLSNEEKENLVRLGDILSEIATGLKSVEDELTSGRTFLGEDGVVESVLPTVFEKFSEPSVEYPTLIYDGPFSDGLEGHKARNLEGNEFTPELGEKKIRAMFDLTEDDGVEYLGTSGGDFKIMSYRMDLSKDGETYVSITLNGGKLLSFVRNADTDVDGGFTDEELIEKAEETALHLGFKNMESVWVERVNGVGYINLALVDNGVIVYPDIVKVKLSLSDLSVLGVDATHYSLNHTIRNFDVEKIGSQDAQSVIDGRMEIERVALTVIPYGEYSERLCYEFKGKINGGDYFVYVDAQSGEEINVLYVVNSESGLLVL
ncbi:MAG: PepSY1/2 domain-containing protein [Christensenellales bacterium]